MSAKQRGKPADSKRAAHSKKPAASDGKTRKQRSGDIGRALRSIYDDTVREAVPGDFLDLLGKLS